MIKKKETKKSVKVTFELDHLPEAEVVEVLGDFNNWQPEPMQKFKNGKHKLTVDLEPGTEYHFRYLVDGNQWENDSEANRQVTNEFGAQ
ncbi:MAG: isoamylase early set domain-containing protein, partial [Ardenticatenales bacterium]|nr:isoamylase early set domain-containing protein [Ardenticatenales bacterium]